MASLQEQQRAERIAAVRAFNRFYTRRIGLLEDGMLRSPFSLAEARVLYELKHGDAPTATEVAESLGLDPGYLSRMVGKFVAQDLVTKSPSPADRRHHRLKLTAKGRRAAAQLDRGSDEIVGALLDGVPADAQERIVKSMRTIGEILRAAEAGEAGAEKPAADRKRPTYLLREHRAGDMGWVVARHGAIYAEERGWDASFEALCAEIVAQFLRTYDPRRERCFIAEIGGEPVGCVFVVRGSDEVAKLRLILVEPKARGLGIGRRLVDECINFARATGYKSMTLWTQSVLTDARRIYQRAGFRLVRTEPHTSFGHDLIGETWEMEL